MNLQLELPWFLLLIPLGLVAVGKLVRQKSSLGFSSSTLLKDVGLGFPLLALEKLFLSVFVSAVSLILARPTQAVRNSVPVYQKARDISLVLDTSGSMVSQKIETATAVVSEFVAGRPQDRIALFVFNTDAYLEWPLSLDHEPLILRLNQARAGGGTRIASGVIAALEHQRRYGQNAGAIIVVSDGGSAVTSEERSAIEASLAQTKFYWIWIVGDDYDQMAQDFGIYVTSLDGQIFRGGIEDLDEIFNQINQLEASAVLYEQRVITVYHFGALPLVALISLLLAAVVDLVREV